MTILARWGWWWCWRGGGGGGEGGLCVCAQVCVCAFGCCFVGANGCIPLTMLVDVCQCCCLLMFVCLPLSRHFPCCKTWWIKNLNLNLKLSMLLSSSAFPFLITSHLIMMLLTVEISIIVTRIDCVHLYFPKVSLNVKQNNGLRFCLNWINS